MSRERGRQIAERLASSSRDTDSLRELVIEHENMVRSLAMLFHRSGVPLPLLIQEGFAAVGSALLAIDEDWEEDLEEYLRTCLVEEFSRFVQDYGRENGRPINRQPIYIARRIGGYTDGPPRNSSPTSPLPDTISSIFSRRGDIPRKELADRKERRIGPQQNRRRRETGQAGP